MTAWVKAGFDVMLKSYAKHLGGTLTYVKHPTDGAVHTYYVNLEDETLIIAVATVPATVDQVGSTSMN
jgi:hypothetical protein